MLNSIFKNIADPIFSVNKEFIPLIDLLTIDNEILVVNMQPPKFKRMKVYKHPNINNDNDKDKNNKNSKARTSLNNSIILHNETHSHSDSASASDSDTDTDNEDYSNIQASIHKLNLKTQTQNKNENGNENEDKVEGYMNIENTNDFWDFIEEICWPDKSDNTFTKVYMKDFLLGCIGNGDNMASFWEYFNKYVGNLYNKYKNNTIVNTLSEKNMYAFFSHIIAKGEEFYNAVMENIELALYLIESNEYMDFFEYE